jgi:hypothetical protein
MTSAKDAVAQEKPVAGPIDIPDTRRIDIDSSGRCYARRMPDSAESALAPGAAGVSGRLRGVSMRGRAIRDDAAAHSRGALQHRTRAGKRPTHARLGMREPRRAAAGWRDGSWWPGYC